MKQIYNFNHDIPPDLNEKKLREIAQQRKLQRQTAALAAGGILMQLCVLFLALIIRFENPVCAIALISYVIVSMMGFAVTLMVITIKRREIKCDLLL